MLVIGLAGGIASGKSLVASLFERFGAVNLDADRVGHLILDEAEVQRALRARWGSTVFANDAKVDRKSVARIVFAPPPDGPVELSFLEQLTHPRIRKRLESRIDELRQADVPAAILDAAVMFKADWFRICDHIVFVDAEIAIREARALQRGWTVEQFRSREAAQTSIERKRELADCQISNSGTKDETRVQVEQLWNSFFPDTPHK